MTSAFRRFEILLPLRFNDGQSVPGELIADTLLELEVRFGAVSAETQAIEGQWRHQGRSYRDDLTRVFVDAPDTPESFEFFREFKEKLKARFQQIDIWVTTYQSFDHSLARRPSAPYLTRLSSRLAFSCA